MSEYLLEIACLPLYSETQAEGKYVPIRNSLNMWNASGRPRHENEAGIPIPIEFRDRHPDFFPGIAKSFDLRLPNFRTLKAKQCQQGGKALMSNPNKELGKWILRDILNIPLYTVVTYRMLIEKEIDSVYIEKWIDGYDTFYKIFPAPLGEYDKYIRGAIIGRKEERSSSVVSEEKTKAEKEVKPKETKPMITFKAGEQIKHKVLGIGVVKKVDGDHIELAFDGETKKYKISWLIEHDMISK